MKKLLFALLTCLAFTATAKEKVTIVYAFGAADSIANYNRTLVDEANRIQNKYTFLFDTKPGAGNAIAANYVKSNPNTILATSSAFFIRPNFYPTESYDVNDFQELMPQCDAPLSISSSKYRSWQEVPKTALLDIGTSGLGVTTHITALQIIKKYPNAQVVPFKSTNESMISTVSGFTDLHIGFLSESELWAKKDDKKLYILGITGSKSMNGHPTLISKGFPSKLAFMNAPQHLVVPRTVPATKFDDWRKILVQAAQSKSVRQAYAIDSCDPLDQMPTSKIQIWYQDSVSQWKQLTHGVKIDK